MFNLITTLSLQLWTKMYTYIIEWPVGVWGRMSGRLCVCVQCACVRLSNIVSCQFSSCQLNIFNPKPHSAIDEHETCVTDVLIPKNAFISSKCHLSLYLSMSIAFWYIVVFCIDSETSADETCHFLYYHEPIG